MSRQHFSETIKRLQTLHIYAVYMHIPTAVKHLLTEMINIKNLSLTFYNRQHSSLLCKHYPARYIQLFLCQSLYRVTAVQPRISCRKKLYPSVSPILASVIHLATTLVQLTAVKPHTIISCLNKRDPSIAISISVKSATITSRF